MPLEPHPTDPDKLVFRAHKIWAMYTKDELDAAVAAEREAIANIDWTPILREGGLVTWGDAATLADRVFTTIRARGKA